VRQGAILSPSLFCVYLDTLLSELRDAGVGCHVGGKFLGAFVYADDVNLLALTRQGLQIMLNICEQIASSHSMSFSTDMDPSKSKTKCLFFSRNKLDSQVRQVVLNGDLLPWVPTAKHLGNHLSSKNNFSSYSPETRTDLLQKRAILFDKVHQIQQQFGYCNPRLIIKLLSIYSTALYGSNLWQINSDEHHKLNRSWNIAVKMIWDLSAPTHTCYLESLSPVPHLEAVLTGRYIGFIQNLACSVKSLLRLLFSSCSSDQNSLTGQNLQYLLLKYKKLTLSSLLADKQSIKSATVYPMTDDKSWKLELMEEICLIRKGHLEIEFESENLENILDYICTS
jgi:hypothetical protein